MHVKNVLYVLKIKKPPYKTKVLFWLRPTFHGNRGKLW